MKLLIYSPQNRRDKKIVSGNFLKLFLLWIPNDICDEFIRNRQTAPCHSERSEESNYISTFQILRFIQDDKAELLTRPSGVTAIKYKEILYFEIWIDGIWNHGQKKVG